MIPQKHAGQAITIGGGRSAVEIWYGEISSEDRLMFCVVDSMVYSNRCVYPTKMESFTQNLLVKS